MTRLEMIMWHLSVNEKKSIFGFGSDSTLVMTGKNNSMAARLKRVNLFPINTHCKQ